MQSNALQSNEYSFKYIIIQNIHLKIKLVINIFKCAFNYEFWYIYIWTFIRTIFPPCNFWYANIFGFWFTQKISHLSHSDLRIIIKVQTKLNTIVSFFKRLHLLTSHFTLGRRIILLFFLYFPKAFKTWR